jgi:hypothetical protein
MHKTTMDCFHYHHSFIHSFTHSSILSFDSLSYDRSTASSIASSTQSAIWCFHFQYLVSSLFLKVIQ